MFFFNTENWERVTADAILNAIEDIDLGRVT